MVQIISPSWLVMILNYSSPSSPTWQYSTAPTPSTIPSGAENSIGIGYHPLCAVSLSRINLPSDDLYLIVLLWGLSNSSNSLIYLTWSSTAAVAAPAWPQFALITTEPAQPMSDWSLASGTVSGEWFMLLFVPGSFTLLPLQMRLSRIGPLNLQATV